MEAFGGTIESPMFRRSVSQSNLIEDGILIELTSMYRRYCSTRSLVLLRTRNEEVMPFEIPSQPS